ncbi:helix-turn-helix transcriptional regulator [Acidithiobacillus sp. MC6.1]|nr:helix-turn-helix transcriptional regulator [Acidithiobacillus sp. MC6.1]
MSEIQKIIGACVRTLREQRSLSQEALAAKAGISYQYLSGVETGKENFTIQVLESLARSLDLPVRALVVAAYDGAAGAKAPQLEAKFFRSQAPLPEALSISHIEAAANLTQSIIHRINRNMSLEIGQTLQSLIQGNNFSGLVSNIFSNAMDECSPYKHNHDQKYPDLIYKQGDGGSGVGLEVKTTINIGKGGESHNGHSGWHVIACYNFVENGDIKFVHLMFAQLNGHQHSEPDWSYVGSKVNSETGSRRTETYVTTLTGTTKLRDGSAYLDANKVNYSRWRQARSGAIPPWSIFAKNTSL